MGGVVFVFVWLFWLGVWVFSLRGNGSLCGPERRLLFILHVLRVFHTYTCQDRLFSVGFGLRSQGGTACAHVAVDWTSGRGPDPLSVCIVCLYD